MPGAPLPGGNALLLDNNFGEVWDARADTWTVINGPLGIGAGNRKLSLLRNGTVLISGGAPNVPATDIFDPVSRAFRRGRDMLAPRVGHAVVVMPNGDVLALGGVSTGGATNSVEILVYGEPELKLTLEPGFYVATSRQGEPNAVTFANDGLAGLNVAAPGGFAGGMHFGGVLSARGGPGAFAAFTLSQPQTTSIAVSAQNASPAGGSLDLTVAILDVGRRIAAGPWRATGSMNQSTLLPAGAYTVEIQSGENSEDLSFQASLLAPGLRGGGASGATLKRATGVPGFLGFYLTSRQEVTIGLLNENTYGRPHGAGEVALTLYDSSGSVLQRVGPSVGAASPDAGGVEESDLVRRLAAKAGVVVDK